MVKKKNRQIRGTHFFTGRIETNVRTVGCAAQRQFTGFPINLHNSWNMHGRVNPLATVHLISRPLVFLVNKRTGSSFSRWIQRIFFFEFPTFRSINRFRWMQVKHFCHVSPVQRECELTYPLSWAGQQWEEENS